MKYIIGSGWWCSDESDGRDAFYGDEDIRSQEFHKLWRKSVDSFTSPDRVIIVDSNSPVKPNYSDDVIFLSLNENAGHSTNHRGKFSGWMRSVILSASYAINCDCDYFVYVEQDVLLQGSNIVEKAIATMKKPYMFGKCHDHNNPLQQSFFIIKKSHLEEFISNIYRIRYTDFDMPPERKFALATSRYFMFIPQFFFVTPANMFLKKVFRRVQNNVSRILGNYDYLPFGYGRDRPINFEDEYFYFQHGDKNELKLHFSLFEDKKDEVCE
ncbi:hypothetical protein KW426_15800 [Vibrio fluvialis]|nr:hypothetical protein [Vibrio fluvialis]MBY7774581.1 hypothetical protein [Vibrio fluvialis]MBY7778773.1 hypothetical protein [Vibrio fluvialis]MBY7988191.1 hypothetical protein [Vibrio fluvialis]MBY7993771.1 hypothetical protein [Vibrio fluvialis]